MTLDELIDKARAIKCPGHKDAWNTTTHQVCGPVHDAIAAAMKGVEEEVTKYIGRCGDCAGHKDIWIRESVYLELKAKLAAYESAAPDSPEVKEAMDPSVKVECSAGDCSGVIHTLRDALCAAQVKIKELENNLDHELYPESIALKSALARLAEAEKELALVKSDLAIAHRVCDATKAHELEAVRIGCENIKSREAAEAKLAAMTPGAVDPYCAPGGLCPKCCPPDAEGEKP